MHALSRTFARHFSVNATTFSNRAIVYKGTGDPTKVLQALTYPLPSPHPPPNTLNIRYLLSPVNPSDINVIEGVYPTRPTPRVDLQRGGLGSEENPVMIAGNEGLAQVSAVGDGVQAFKPGDWVVMVKQQSGTWAMSANVTEAEVVKIPRDPSQTLTEVQGATISVNLPTALNMLREFVTLQSGDWVIQNGANSAVGQAVIQIATRRDLKTINLVRNRDDIAALKKELTDLGATHVLTYEELADKASRAMIKQWTSGANIRLALNCVSGLPTKHMAALLGRDAHLVSYGAMSRQPLELSTSLFIFKNLTAHGFWQSRWYEEKGKGEREALMRELVALMTDGKFKSADHTIMTIASKESDEVVTQKVRAAIARILQGRHGKKLLLKFEDVEK